MNDTTSSHHPHNIPNTSKEMGNAAPIIALYGMLKRHARVEILLLHDAHTRFTGDLWGFDEFMNLVLENAQEIVKGHTSSIGRIILKGDNIAAISAQ